MDLLPNRCACINLAPVRLPDDEHGGERFQCYNCHYKWRIKEDHILPCRNCGEWLVDIKKLVNEFIICKVCTAKFQESDYKVHRYICLW